MLEKASSPRANVSVLTSLTTYCLISPVRKPSMLLRNDVRSARSLGTEADLVAEEPQTSLRAS